ncbi:MAG: hypothetical protein KYX68_07070, partial [Flavobacterium sp.]|nr:hypothetical protein [Flavobacterium sp.]
MKKNNINLYHSSLGKVLSSRKRKVALNSIKNLLDYKELCDVSDSLTKSIQPLNFTFFGNPFPKTLEEFGKGEMLFKPLLLENEFKWTFLSFRKFSNEIINFLILKYNFEKFFLLFDYNSSEKIIYK